MSTDTSSPSMEPPTTSKKALTAHQSRKLDPSTSSKPCSHCQTPSDVLIRCQTRALNEVDAEGKWYLLCPGKCWMIASGGVVDGSVEARKKGYRYGGVWKNKKGAVSGKKPKGKYNRVKKGQNDGNGEHEQHQLTGDERDEDRERTLTSSGEGTIGNESDSRTDT